MTILKRKQDCRFIILFIIQLKLSCIILKGVFEPYTDNKVSDQLGLFSQFGPHIIKLFSHSTQLHMKFVLLIYLKVLTIANSFLLNIAEHENFSANKYVCLC